MTNKELVIISDTHIAQVWNKIDKIIPKKHNFLNPNKHFNDIINSIKENQILIINGDLVDYHYVEYNSDKNTNWDLLFDIAKSCKGKIYYNIGNHDYRGHPYNFSIYGLRHNNIPDNIRKKFSDKIGFNNFRGIGELKSIIVRNKNIKQLNKFHKKRSYKVELNDKKLLFFDTGPDAFSRLKNFMNIPKWRLLFTFHPVSEGLDNNQISFLKKNLDNNQKNIFIFVHCPPFFSETKIPKIKINKETYYKDIVKYKMKYGSFINNNWEFVELLLSSKNNITIITSHTHLPKQYLLNKKSKILEETTIKKINKHGNDKNYIKFITTLPLGAIRKFNKKVGKLVIGKNISYKVIKDYKK